MRLVWGTALALLVVLGCSQNCGLNVGGCGSGLSLDGLPVCCSGWGWCGSTSVHCSPDRGCQPDYGYCDSPLPSYVPSPTPPIPTPSPAVVTQCGPSGLGAACPNPLCCSQWGWCGTGPDFCSTSCQTGYGWCDNGSVSPSPSQPPNSFTASNSFSPLLSLTASDSASTSGSTSSTESTSSSGSVSATPTGNPSPSDTQTPTSLVVTPTPIPASITPSVSDSITPVVVVVPSASPSQSWSATQSPMPSPFESPSQSTTATASMVTLPSISPSISITTQSSDSNSPSPTASLPASASATATVSDSFTATISQSASASPSATVTSTISESVSMVPSVTPSSSQSSTVTVTVTASLSALVSPSPIQSNSPTPLASTSPTGTKSHIPTPSPPAGTGCGQSGDGIVCPPGWCCSNSGYCGQTAVYCSAGTCQVDFGDCWVTPSASPSLGYTPSNTPSFSPTRTLGSPTPSPAYSGTVTTICGNSVCENSYQDSGETCGNCPVDCGPCQALADAFQCLANGQYALTLDDGPKVGPTNSVLGNLTLYNITASFFLIGKNIDAAGALLQTEVNSGHSTLSHTWSHPYLTQISLQQVYNEMIQADASFAKYTCRRPTLMRPPYGDINHASRAVLNRMGYRAVKWSIDTRDWDFAQNNPSWVLNNFTTNLALAAPNGVFSLEHDVFQYTADLVPKVIDIVLSQGYRFVSLEECLWGPLYQRNPSWVYMHRNCNSTMAKWPLAVPDDPCPVSEWSEWSVCDAPCGTGSQTRVRLTLPPGQEHVTIACASVQLIQQQPCAGPVPCSPACVYSPWTFLSPCSAPCGGGTQISVRTVVSGTNCGGLVQTFLCNTQACAIPGQRRTLRRHTSGL